MDQDCEANQDLDQEAPKYTRLRGSVGVLEKENQNGEVVRNRITSNATTHLFENPRQRSASAYPSSHLPTNGSYGRAYHSVPGAVAGLLQVPPLQTHFADSECKMALVGVSIAHSGRLWEASRLEAPNGVCVPCLHVKVV